MRNSGNQSGRSGPPHFLHSIAPWSYSHSCFRARFVVQIPPTGKNNPVARIGVSGRSELRADEDYGSVQPVSLTELESEVQKLSPAELGAFTRWLDEFAASRWDAQLEKDVGSGKLSTVLSKADADFESGKCSEL